MARFRPSRATPKPTSNAVATQAAANDSRSIPTHEFTNTVHRARGTRQHRLIGKVPFNVRRELRDSCESAIRSLSPTPSSRSSPNHVARLDEAFPAQCCGVLRRCHHPNFVEIVDTRLLGVGGSSSRTARSNSWKVLGSQLLCTQRCCSRKQLVEQNAQ